jgi:hypothetical protein
MSSGLRRRCSMGQEIPKCLHALGEYQDRGSVGTALYAFGLLRAYAVGERDEWLAEWEIRGCIDVPARDLDYAALGFSHRPSIVDVWAAARWCRERDVMRDVTATKGQLKSMHDTGLIERERKVWFNNAWAIPFEQALFVQKYLRVRPFLKRVLGPAARWDVDMISALPLPTLLGVLCHPKLIRELCDTISDMHQKKEAARCH